MEKIFTENGIPTNYVKLYYPDDNYLYSMIDDRKTRMYIAAEMLHFKNLELKCDEPTSEKEVILYGIWSGSGAKGKVIDENYAEDPNEIIDEEIDKKKIDDDDDDYDDEDCETDKYGICINGKSSFDSSSILNLSILLFMCLLLM